MNSNENSREEMSDQLAKLRKEISDLSERERKLRLVAGVLRDSELRFRRLLEKSRHGYFVCKPDGQILDINPAGMKLFGYLSKEDFLGDNNMNNLYQNPSNLDRYYQLMKSQGFVQDFELILRKKDGGILFALVTAIVIKDKKGNVVEYRGIISDDTEKIKNELRVKQIDVELMISNQELERVKKSSRLPVEIPEGGKKSHGIGTELSSPVGDVVNNFNILKNYLGELMGYVKSLEWLVNHIQDYDETIFLVNEIQKVQDIKRNKNIEYILEDTENLLNISSRDFARITSLISRLKK
jgi:PAS domain S-box-containing protein